MMFYYEKDLVNVGKVGEDGLGNNLILQILKLLIFQFLILITLLFLFM